MAIALYESEIYGALFSDPHVAALFSDARRARAMVEVEVALAQVQAELGIIPRDAALAIARAAESFEPDLEALGAGTRLSGVPVIALVDQLRAATGRDAAPFLHHGATSQDIVDSAHVLLLKEALHHLERQLAEVSAELGGLADRHRDTVMAARTRMQQALPTTFGLKAAGWLMPLIRHRRRLDELKARVLVVQLGGAAGTLAALGQRGVAVMESLAARLGLSAPPSPWHAQRDGFAEAAGWLSLVTGSIAKIGCDIILMSQSEVGEVAESGPPGAGASSTMPNKRNPIQSEMLLTAARMNTSLLSNMHHALLAEHERGVHGWPLEWNTLPQMLCCTAVALGHAGSVLKGLVVDARRMAGNIDDAGGLVLAERVVFGLAEQMDRRRAEALVREACADVHRSGRHLMDVLKQADAGNLDWQALRDPSGYLGENGALIDRVLAALAGLTTRS